jgi:adenylylsulfate kinase|tara:strand:- start:627 stop:1133 length:507 start_codon:yes stop_codon:yes gene_type:complete
MTGLPCSGKTTLAKKLSEHISNLAILDGDEMRELLSPNEDFSRNGIIGHNKKVANIAKLLLDHNVPVCVSKISPFVENREDARKVLSNYSFLEVYVKCSIDSCEKRDVRGMYKKARNGEISDFIGIHVTYEPPTKPELIIDTENSTIDQTVQKILDYLDKNKLIENTK